MNSKIENPKDFLNSFRWLSSGRENIDPISLEDFRRSFPIHEQVPRYFPPEEKADTFFLSDSKGFVKVPWTDELFKEIVARLSSLIKSSGIQGKVLSLEPIEVKGTFEEEVPTYHYLGKIIEEMGDSISKGSFQNEEEAFDFGFRNIRETEALIGDAARVLRFLRFLKGKMGKELRKLEVRYLFLTGYPEIPTIFAFQAKGIFPKVEVREFYSSPLGILGVQLGEKPGINLVDTAFFEWKTRKEIKLPSQAKKGEYGKLVVSTRQVPRFALPETFLSLGNGVFKNEGAEERYPL
ncbi:MAG: hypothetical protein NUV68_08560, partial [Caldiserica bacterium]|nr:hypothetical protein [Caldisericota bacterium]